MKDQFSRRNFTKLAIGAAIVGFNPDARSWITEASNTARPFDRLPKLDGFGVLEALRKDPRTERLPVVILSNYSERELIDRGLRLGALDYLIKTQTTPAHLSRGMEGWLKD